MNEPLEDEQLSQVLGDFGAAARRGAERPEEFWERQRTEIRARLARPRRASTLWTMSAAAACVALLILQLREPRLPERGSPDADEQLLVAVEQSLERRIPDALEPAALLAAEMNKAAEQQAKP